jgi:hypothetical protein
VKTTLSMAILATSRLRKDKCPEALRSKKEKTSCAV